MGIGSVSFSADSAYAKSGAGKVKPPRPHPKSKRLEVKDMTVCVAALAAKTDAIVCIADKALSYGDYIQWDSDNEKILQLNPGRSVVMYSDEGNGPRVLDKIFEKASELSGKPRDHVIRVCEEQYKAAFDDLIEATFLRPRLITRQQYTAAITASQMNDMLRSLADEIKTFDIKCDLLICGFDGDEVPFILDIQSPGIARDMTQVGFQAIGSGWEKAISRLLFSEHKRNHPIERVLYDCFDAKANAEIAVGVGYEWDAEIILGGKLGSHIVPKEIKELIEKVWGRYQRSPFEKYDPKEYEKGPPKDWREKLEMFSNSIKQPSQVPSLPNSSHHRSLNP